MGSILCYNELIGKSSILARSGGLGYAVNQVLGTTGGNGTNLKIKPNWQFDRKLDMRLG